MPQTETGTQTATETPGHGRRGRPRRGEREERQQAVLNAALAELVEKGYDATTMLSIASRAGASKETLYAWFGNRDGLLRALIERSADGSAHLVRSALDADTDPRSALTGYAAGLLTLLASPGSIALNRAAMTDLELAHLLLRSGRHRVGPIVERYLDRLHRDGTIHAPDSAAAYRLLYGLVVEDTQIRVLLGEEPPTAQQINAHCQTAIDRYLHLVRR